MIEDPAERIVLVSGATGQQGGAVTRHLLDLGFQVRALTRSPDSGPAEYLRELGATVVEGDFLDRTSLDRALEGVYGAYSVQNPWVAGIAGEVEQGKAFADAVEAADVDIFVYSSVAAADRETGIPHFESKWEIEEHIRELDLPATILRPVYFMDNWSIMEDVIRGGQIPQPLSPDTSLQQIAVSDIGAFAAKAFADPDSWRGRAIELAGDELTMLETADTFSEALEIEVEYVQVPWEGFEEQLGPEMTTMYRWFESDGYTANIPELRKEHPDLHTLETFLEASHFTA